MTPIISSPMILRDSARERRIGAPMPRHFTAVYRKEGDWWAAYVEELPGANTQGKTIDEARENLKEAIALILDANRQEANRIFKGGEVVREDLVVNVQ